jgi:NodT family efflux transporter outer membrane factor (OMF) lipoprotein
MMPSGAGVLEAFPKAAGRFLTLIPGRQGLLLASAALLASCAVGPDFKRPAPPTASRYSPSPMADATSSAPGVAGGDAERFVMGRDIPFAWWTQFNSPRLDALVAKALAANPTLPAAMAALRQAQEQVAAQRGFFYPTISPSFQPSRQQLAGNLGGNSPGLQGNGSTISTFQNPAGPPFNGPVTYNFYTAQVAVGYTPDVFGANRRQVESLKAQADALRYQMEAAYITLATNVVAAAVQEGSLQSQIKATWAFIDANRQALGILQEQLRQGYVTRIDVAAQESALAQARSLLPPLQKQLEQTHDLIRALVGGLPGDDVDMVFDLDAFTLPRALPVSLPAQLIDQRPDVRAAEEQVHAASAQVGVAIANRLPQFTITAAYGGAASEVSQLFSTGGPFWSLIGDASVTVFDGGTLRHRQHAAEQGLVQARAQYRSTLITALQNVADTLHAIQSDADSLAVAADAETAAKAALDTTRSQSDLGYVNYQTLLAAQGAYEQAVTARVQAQTNRFGDAAALFQALGGGWWNRKTPAQGLASRGGDLPE